jgi:beta-glucanase (GH16 family)
MIPRVFIAFFISSVLAGCNVGTNDLKDKFPIKNTAVLFDRDSIVFALNAGGKAHIGIDGVRYQADAVLTDDSRVPTGKIRGAQDGTIYRSYRSGSLNIQRQVANGLYDVTFQFAELEDIAMGERVFDIVVNGKRVIESLDVLRARDGNHRSALDRTVTGVIVDKGELDIELLPGVSSPILNGLVIRRQKPDSRSWDLIWGDEFDRGDTPDRSNWNIDIWRARKVNDEDQAYTDREKNIRVVDGKLILEAHRESFDDAAYTSGRVQSQGKGDFLYGRVDIRAKLPAGQGTWPALWMLPSDPYRYATSCGDGEDWHGSTSCDAWPNSGEIDIMEHVGYDMGHVHGTVHNRAFYWANQEQRKGSVEVPDAGKAFHIYSLEWAPEHIHIYLDGSLYFSYYRQQAAWEAWPYDHSYHLILNLAVGGMWGRAGGPIDDDIFPVSMEVDYVRVFKARDSETRGEDP